MAKTIEQERLDHVAKAIFASYQSPAVAAVAPPWSVCYPQAKAAIAAIEEFQRKPTAD